MLVSGADEDATTGMLGTLAGGGITIVELYTGGGGGGGRLLVTAAGVLEDSGQTLVVV